MNYGVRHFFLTLLLLSFISLMTIELAKEGSMMFEPDTLLEGIPFTYEIDGQSYSGVLGDEDDLPYGEGTATIRFALPSRSQYADTVGFYVSQERAEVYLDGEKIFSHLADVSDERVRDTMFFLCLAPVGENAAGRMVEIRITPAEGIWFPSIPELHYGLERDIENHYLDEQMDSLLGAFPLLAMSIFSLILIFPAREKETKDALFSVFFLTLLFSLWLFSQSQSKFFYLVNPTIPHYIALFCIYSLPFALSCYLQTHYDFKGDRRFMHVIVLLSTILLLVFSILAILDLAGVYAIVSTMLTAAFLSLSLILLLFAFAAVEHFRGVRDTNFLVALALVISSFVAEAVLLLLSIELDSPVVLHLLMFAGCLIFFLKSAQLFLSDGETDGKRNLEKLLRYDSLTGALSRAEYEDFVSFRHRRRLAVIIMDYDGLDEINSSEGRKAGDDILMALASALMSANPDGRLFRMGGDEFAFFIPVADGVSACDVRNSISVVPYMDKVTFGLAIAEKECDLGGPLRIADDELMELKKRRK